MINYKPRTLIIIVLLAGVMVIFSSNIFANSSSYSEYDKDGVTVYPVENKNIVMKAELVQIYPDTDNHKSWRAKHTTWRAKCKFTFHNKSDLKESVTMGYPDWLNNNFDGDDESFGKYFDSLPEKTRKDYYYGAGLEELGYSGYRYVDAYFQGYAEGKLPYISEAWNLHDLEVKIDGEEVETVHKAVTNAGSLPGHGAYIWKITFAPYETKMVEVSFSFSGYIIGDVGNEFDYQKASYILRTGALWADKIGVADIYWDIKDRNVNIKEIVPRNYTIKDDILHWHFENFKPNEDIVITTHEGRDLDTIISVLLLIYKPKIKYDGNSRQYTEFDFHNTNYSMFSGPYDDEFKIKAHRLYIKALRNEIYARHGRKFDSADMRDLFGNCDWYKPNDNYSNDMLNQYEKKNIEFLSVYEKRKGWRQTAE